VVASDSEAHAVEHAEVEDRSVPKRYIYACVMTDIYVRLHYNYAVLSIVVVSCCWKNGKLVKS